MSLSKLSHFRRWLAPPTFEDEVKTERARLQRVIFLGAIAVVVALDLATLLLDPTPLPRLVTTNLWIPAALVSFFLMRRGNLERASILFSISAWLILTLVAWLSGGVMSAASSSYTVLILLVGILVGFRTSLIFAGLSLAAGLGMLYAESNGALPTPLLSTTPTSMWAALAANFIAAAVLLALAHRSLSAALERTRTSEAALRTSNRDLGATRFTLEERSKELATAVELLENQLPERQQMADSLQQNEAELRQLNAELERRVRERAGQLAEANEALTQEIATRQQAQAALQETFAMIEQAKQEWEVTADALPQLVCLIDQQGRIKRTNRTVERWGLAPVTKVKDQAVGRLLHPDCHDPECELERLWNQATTSLIQGCPAEFEIDDPQLGRYLHCQLQPVGTLAAERYRPADVLGVLVVHDITGRKQSEQKLAESEERYRSLFEDSPISIWEEDLSEVKLYLDRLRADGVQDFRTYFETHPEALIDCLDRVEVIDVNQATLSLYQANDKKELLGRLGQIFDEFSLDLVKEELVALAAGETRYGGETSAKTLAGDRRHIDLTLAVAPGYEETWSKAVVSIVDVTERQQVELELARYRDHLEDLVNERTAQLNQTNLKLQQSEENFRSLADNAQDGFIIIVGDEQFVYTNHRLAEMTGYSPAELRQLSIKDLAHPDQHEILSDRYRRRLAGEDFTSQYETVLVCKNGQSLPVELTAAKTTWFGQPAAIASLRDISERKRAEARYQALFEQAPAMYVITRNEGGNPVITDCNNLFVSALAYSRAEVIGRSLANFYTPESRASLLEDGGYQRALAGSFTAEERRLVTAEGRPVDVLLQAEPELDAAGKVFGTRAMFVDITHRKQAENELRLRNQELQTLQAASAAISSTLELDQILRTVTHEITNLLGVESCYFSEWDRTSDTIYRIAAHAPGGWRGDGPEPELYHLADYPVTRHVLLKQTPVQMTLSRPDIDPAERAYMRQANIKTLMVLPMVYQDQAIGLVDIEDSRFEQTFTDRQIAVVEALVDQAVVAMQNARLYEQAREEIAERRRAEQELRHSEERFRRVITSISDHVYVTEITPGGEHFNLYISPNVETLTGYPPEQILAEWALWANEIIHPADQAAAAAQLAELDQGRPSEAEYRVIRREGEVIWVRDSARVEIQDSSKIIYGVINDITARKQAEAAIVQYSERLEILRQIERGILSAQSVDEIGQSAMSRIRRLIPCHSATVTIFDYRANEAVVITGETDIPGQPLSSMRTKLIQSGRPNERFNLLKQRQIIMLDEAELAQDYEVLRKRSIRSVMVAPLLYQDELIGTLNLSATEAGTFTPEHQEIAHQVAGQLAIAMRQADLHEQTQQHATELELRVADRMRELAALYEVTALASQAVEVPVMLAQVLEQILAAVRSEVGLIWLCDDEVQQRFHLLAQQGLSGEELDQVKAEMKEQGWLNQVVGQNQPLILPNLILTSSQSRFNLPVNLQALVGLPIQAGGQVLGVFIVFGHTAKQFNLEDVALLNTVADQIGVALENNRLRQQAREAAVMAERERLARDLHDSVTQSLYSLSLFAESGLEEVTGGRVESVRHYLTRIAETTQQALKEMRLMIYELRPVDLERLGLMGALHRRLATVEQRSGITARLIAEELIELPLPIEQEFYAITQEALNNILKHAQATQVDVHLRRVGAEVELTISDNGQGFNPDEVETKGGLGLRGIRERVEMIDGTLAVHSVPAKGTIIEVQVKISQN